MKIYNRKSFLTGIFLVALGAWNLVMDFIRHTVEWKGIVLAFALFFLGGGTIVRSVSRSLAKEDQLEKMDERNQLIQLKSSSKAFRLTQAISFGLMLAFLVLGKVSGYSGFLPMAVGLAFACSISLFAELFTYLYYEAKN